MLGHCWLFLAQLTFLLFPSALFQQFPQQSLSFAGQPNVTAECLDQAHFRDCSVFTHCCSRKCPQGRAHRCMSFLGMIDQGQTACDCPSLAPFGPTSSTPYGPPSSQWPSNFGQPQQPNPFASSTPSPFVQPWPSSPQPPWPSPQNAWPSSPAPFPLTSSPSPPSWPSFLSSPQPSFPGQPASGQFQRPQPGDPSSLRSLFQSIGQPIASSAQSSRLQRIGRAHWWREFGRKADFVGGILLLFVLDLLLLSLAI